MAPRVVAPRQLEAELDAARVNGLERACLAAEHAERLPNGLLLALASRETHCRNVTGDGGHGRGFFQIDDRFHAAWLADHGAVRPGAVPPVQAAALYAAQILTTNLAFGRRHGVHGADQLKFALSAYNAGLGRALQAYRLGDSDLPTTGADFGADVLGRMRLIQRGPRRAGARRQVPPLPASMHFPNDRYPRGFGWMGLQPWIVPQARALFERFGLRVLVGWSDDSRHALRSDHRWGGACDLVGPRAEMAACTLWADRYCSDPYRRGMVFRWVGGPARDASGVEPGHADHVHLSWYRLGPATTIFSTPEFS